MADRAHLERLTKELVDQGKLIEAGWVGSRIACGLLDAPADQLREMRMAFFAGAQHLMSSIVSFLDPGEEPTDADLKRMDMLNSELQAFIEDFKLKAFKPTVTAPSPPRPPHPGLGDQPIEAKFREQMNVLAGFLDEQFNGKGKPRETGFVLLTFPFGDKVLAPFPSPLVPFDLQGWSLLNLRVQCRAYDETFM